MMPEFLHFLQTGLGYADSAWSAFRGDPINAMLAIVALWISWRVYRRDKPILKVDLSTEIKARLDDRLPVLKISICNIGGRNVLLRKLYLQAHILSKACIPSLRYHAGRDLRFVHFDSATIEAQSPPLNLFTERKDANGVPITWKRFRVVAIDGHGTRYVSRKLTDAEVATLTGQSK